MKKLKLSQLKAGEVYYKICVSHHKKDKPDLVIKIPKSKGKSDCLYYTTEKFKLIPCEDGLFLFNYSSGYAELYKDKKSLSSKYSKNQCFFANLRDALDYAVFHSLKMLTKMDLPKGKKKYYLD